MSSLNESNLTANEKFLLIVLRSWGNKEGECEASLRVLEKDTSLTRPTVKKVLTSLLGKGLVTKITQGGGRLSSRYRINEGGSKATDCFFSDTEAKNVISI